MGELIPDRMKYMFLGLVGLAAIGGALLMNRETAPAEPPVTVKAPEPVASAQVSPTAAVDPDAESSPSPAPAAAAPGEAKAEGAEGPLQDDGWAKSETE